MPRKLLVSNLNGLFAVIKPTGITSAGLVNKLKTILVNGKTWYMSLTLCLVSGYPTETLITWFYFSVPITRKWLLKTDHFDWPFKPHKWKSPILFMCVGNGDNTTSTTSTSSTICEASLSHHTLYMGSLVSAYTCITYKFPCWQKINKNYKKERKQKVSHRTDFEADPWPETKDYFWGPYKKLCGHRYMLLCMVSLKWQNLITQTQISWSLLYAEQNLQVQANRHGNGELSSKQPKRFKLGHGGTLDMNASGVLVIGIGRGTKMLASILKGNKVMAQRLKRSSSVWVIFQFAQDLYLLHW